MVAACLAEGEAELREIGPGLVEAAADILGDPHLGEAEIEARMLALAKSPMTARRLVDCVPESFGLLLIAHLGALDPSGLPQHFSARDATGGWRSFPFSAEPIFAASGLLAARMLHNGPRAKFETIAKRSALLASVNKALNAGADLSRARLSGPALIGAPAEFYASD